jgi:GDP/UDP-N,N'-diacetylbacillosamine 2-epimerase (hydrolysing)
VDDALRHAITKLAHIHFPATAGAAERIEKLGEDRWRIHRVGSPGIDGIVADALPWDRHRALTQATQRGAYALVLLHPTEADDAAEYRRARVLLRSCRDAGFPEVIAVEPNNDPGSDGIRRAIRQSRVCSHQNVTRGAFLGLMRDAAVLVGNSSSGIIEAASFGTPVVDVGPRQAGRERGENVTTVPFRQAAIRRALAEVWNGGRPRRFAKKNPYGRGDTARRIAGVLASVTLSPRLRRKLIAY